MPRPVSAYPHRGLVLEINPDLIPPIFVILVLMFCLTHVLMLVAYGSCMNLGEAVGWFASVVVLPPMLLRTEDDMLFSVLLQLLDAPLISLKIDSMETKWTSEPIDAKLFSSIFDPVHIFHLLLLLVRLETLANHRWPITSYYRDALHKKAKSIVLFSCYFIRSCKNILQAGDYLERRYTIVIRSTMGSIDLYLVSKFEEKMEELVGVATPPRHTNVAKPASMEGFRTTEAGQSSRPKEVLRNIQHIQKTPDLNASHDFGGMMKITPDVDADADYWLLQCMSD